MANHISEIKTAHNTALAAGGNVYANFEAELRRIPGFNPHRADGAHRVTAAYDVVAVFDDDNDNLYCGENLATQGAYFYTIPAKRG